MNEVTQAGMAEQELSHRGRRSGQMLHVRGCRGPKEQPMNRETGEQHIQVTPSETEQSETNWLNISDPEKERYSLVRYWEEQEYGKKWMPITPDLSACGAMSYHVTLSLCISNLWKAVDGALPLPSSWLTPAHTLACLHTTSTWRAAFAPPLPADKKHAAASIIHFIQYPVWLMCFPPTNTWALGNKDAPSPSEQGSTWHTVDVCTSHFTDSWKEMTEFGWRRFVFHSFNGINWRWRRT